MSFIKIEIHKRDLPRKKELFRAICPTKNEYDSVMEHLRALSLGEITGKPVKERRQIKLLDMLTIFFKNFKKSTSGITREDLRNFKEDLLNDKIIKHNGGAYSNSTKEDATEVIARYLEFKYPKRIGSFSSKYQTFRKWFVILAPKTTPEILTEEEVLQLYEGCKTPEGRFIVSVLFDSGVRIEEFLNVRFEDVKSPTKTIPYFQIEVKREYSKTLGRMIGMYWEKSKEAISEYLASVDKTDLKDQVLPKNYDAVRMYLNRLGNRILGKKVAPHMLRKSSATYYANKGVNKMELCKRYGWKFSSEMPDVYIARSGIQEKRVADMFKNDDLKKINMKNEKLTEKFKEQKKEVSDLKELLEQQAKNQEKMNKQIKSILGNA